MRSRRRTAHRAGPALIKRRRTAGAELWCRQTVEDLGGGAPDALAGLLNDLSRRLVADGSRPRGDVGDRVDARVHAMRGADHQSDGLRLDLADRRDGRASGLSGRACRMCASSCERSSRAPRHPCRYGPRPSRDEVGSTVRAADRGRIRHGTSGRSPRPRPSRASSSHRPAGCFTFGAVPEPGCSGIRRTRRLRDVPHVRGPTPIIRERTSRRRAAFRLAADDATMWRRQARGSRTRGDGREDHVAALPFAHTVPECLPLPEAGDECRHRRRDQPLLVRRRVLRPDEQGVVERSRAELGREFDSAPPLVTGRQLLDGTARRLCSSRSFSSTLEMPTARLSCRRLRPGLPSLVRCTAAARWERWRSRDLVERWTCHRVDRAKCARNRPDPGQNESEWNDEI